RRYADGPGPRNSKNPIQHVSNRRAGCVVLLHDTPLTTAFDENRYMRRVCCKRTSTRCKKCRHKNAERGLRGRHIFPIALECFCNERTCLATRAAARDRQDTRYAHSGDTNRTCPCVRYCPNEVRVLPQP